MQASNLRDLQTRFTNSSVNDIIDGVVSVEGEISKLLMELSKSTDITVNSVNVTPIKQLASRSPVGYIIRLEFDL